MGGTKTLDLDKIRELQPDLIIANHEENEKSQIEALQKDFEVYVSDVRDLNDAYLMIKEVGSLVGKETEANTLISDIQTAFTSLEQRKSKEKVIYLIWQKPYMSVGKDTFIHDMINRCGWTNLLQHQERYPELTIGEIRQLQPDRLLLSSEPYPFKEEQQAEMQKLLPLTQVQLVDGEMFSWYGSRLLKAPSYFASLL